jgi:uncharacterized membrane protein YkoI
MFNILVKLATPLLLAAFILSGLAARTGFADEKPAKKADEDKKKDKKADEDKKKDEGKKKDDKDNKAEWVGSIKVEKKLSKDELAKLAKITKKEAKAAAVKAVKGGEAEDAELKVVRGYLVYVVEVEVESGKEEKEYDVIVDAGNGKVLAKHEEDD